VRCPAVLHRKPHESAADEAGAASHQQLHLCCSSQS
jgi:hypothetical protein